MNGKTPISALQELTQARKLPAPVYTEQSFGFSFKCTVCAAGVTATGISSTKKAARHESAKNALQKLGSVHKTQELIFLKTMSLAPLEKSMKNYVGELNEFSSGRGVNYPEYECEAVSTSGEFFTKCIFLGTAVMGRGSNKKDSKQDSARRMLELVKSTDLIVTASDRYKIVPDQSNIAVENREKIFNLYKSLSLKDPEDVPKTDKIDAMPLINFNEEDSAEELKKKLRQYCIEYTLKEWQRSPSVVSVETKGTKLCFMGSGKNLEEATRMALRDVLEAAKSGCSLSTNDLMSFLS